MTTIRDKFSEFLASDDVAACNETFLGLISSCDLHLKDMLPRKRYMSIRDAVQPHLPYRLRTFFSMLDERWKRCEHMSTMQEGLDRRVFVSGAGPVGLRAAVEALLVGFAHVTLSEMRNGFSRHNILKTWRVTVEDMLGFGLKLYMPHFQAKADNAHLATRVIQMVLYKTFLLFGGEAFHDAQTTHLVRPSADEPRWRALVCPRAHAANEQDEWLSLKAPDADDTRLERKFKCDYLERTDGSLGAAAVDESDECVAVALAASGRLVPFDHFLLCEGERSDLLRQLGFDKKVQRFGRAIGLVVNLEYDPSVPEEKRLREFVVSPGQGDAVMMDLLEKEIRVETLEYMRQDTHFIAATVIKEDLEKHQVLKRTDCSTVREALQRENIDRDALLAFARTVANCCKLPEKPFTAKHGVELFDFSTKSHCERPLLELPVDDVDGVSSPALLMPCGDALLEPYWPQGLGVNRGLHTALDAVYVSWRHSVDSEQCSDADISVTDTRDLCYAICRQYFNFGARCLHDKAIEWTCEPWRRYSREHVYKRMHMECVERGEPTLLPDSYVERFGLFRPQ